MTSKEPPTDFETRRKLDPQVRSWLVRRMYSERFKKVEEWLARFEALAACLSHVDMRPLDLEAAQEISGIPASLLGDALRRVGLHFELIERSVDHEGTWYSLKLDPFVPPGDALKEIESPKPHEETDIERLYRECCDEVNAGLRRTVGNLDNLRGKVEPAVGALLMDSCADLLQLSILLTRISATGVKGDKEDYIRGLREEILAKLKGS